jgi:hypothetical protein
MDRNWFDRRLNRNWFNHRLDMNWFDRRFDRNWFDRRFDRGLEIFLPKNYCRSVVLQYNFLHRRDNNLNLVSFYRNEKVGYMICLCLWELKCDVFVRYE